MPDEKKFIVSLTEQELAEIEKLEHSFRQVLAYDETFKEIFKGGGK